jgi:hypothetical protein
MPNSEINDKNFYNDIVIDIIYDEDDDDKNFHYHLQLQLIYPPYYYSIMEKVSLPPLSSSPSPGTHQNIINSVYL